MLNPRATQCAWWPSLSPQYVDASASLESKPEVRPSHSCFAFGVDASHQEWEGRCVGMSNSVTTAIRGSVREMAIGKTRTTEKSDRATVEQLHQRLLHMEYVTNILFLQAIDPRTRMVLFKMLNRGVFHDINGCISTGKEVCRNFNFCTDDTYCMFQFLILKKLNHSIFFLFSNRQMFIMQSKLIVRSGNQSIQNFYSVYLVAELHRSEMDRDRYVQGDYRFRHGYCRRNPRKMVKTWAEKEMRNLMRLKAAGIRCPTPILLRLHVLVMEFIGILYFWLMFLGGCACTGKAGWAAPRLKDAALSLDKLREGYVEVIIAMRTLYQKCKLVHGDLSEYNILYFEGHLYIIDVSQSVDLDHPRAIEFLIEDCDHVSDFFEKHGVAVMTIRELFDFIVDPTIADEAVDSYLEELEQKILARGGRSVEDKRADSEFKQLEAPKMYLQAKKIVFA
ncbi:serine/threonine-protein kinase rio1 [Quercus suber]|uniref:Serine/threonine-protein kinase RIO1 n=1 Tax=Quercus suber TaxID=58331 RepID=A0AAW0JC53_QUESU